VFLWFQSVFERLLFWSRSPTSIFICLNWSLTFSALKRKMALNQPELRFLRIFYRRKTFFGCCGLFSFSELNREAPSWKDTPCDLACFGNWTRILHIITEFDLLVDESTMTNLSFSWHTEQGATNDSAEFWSVETKNVEVLQILPPFFSMYCT